MGYDFLSKDLDNRYVIFYNIISNGMSGQNREDIQLGMEVDIILKQDQQSGQLTRGIVESILTNSQFHPHGIKVRLTSGGGWTGPKYYLIKALHGRSSIVVKNFWCGVN